MENTFMIIDDDVNIRKMLEILIRKNNLGRVICTLDSGEHALEEIAFYNPDVVLIDLLLPVMDGIEIINLIKKQGYSGKIIMISQVEDEEMISRAYESGVVFFIGKPINSIEVINVMKGVCYNIELEKSLALIKNTVLNFSGERRPSEKSNLDEEITKVFNDIGIAGSIGSCELRKVIHKIINMKKKNPNFTYQLQTIYEEIVQEENGYNDININKKALEQRIRRAIQKALNNIAELGCDDYSNSVFIEYATLLFDFKQVRQQMRYIDNPKEEQGKIITKKFIEGIINKLN